MNKKVLIILIIIALIIASITGVLIIQSKSKNINFSDEKIDKFEEKNIVENNEIQDNISNEIIENLVQEEITAEETNQEAEIEKVTITETPKQEQVITTSSNTKQSNKTSNVEIPKQETTKEQPKTGQVTQTETKVTETKVEPIQETKPSVSQCTDTKHGVGVGNSGKWFNSKQEAINYFDSIQKTWGDKWEKFEIDDDTYDKNCPCRHEEWTCPFCGKWTINFYYRK